MRRPIPKPTCAMAGPMGYGYMSQLYRLDVQAMAELCYISSSFCVLHCFHVIGIRSNLKLGKLQSFYIWLYIVCCNRNISLMFNVRSTAWGYILIQSRHKGPVDQHYCSHFPKFYALCKPISLSDSPPSFQCASVWIFSMFKKFHVGSSSLIFLLSLQAVVIH